MLRAEALSALDWLSRGFIQLNLESCPQFISSHFPTTCHRPYYLLRDTFYPAVQPASPKAPSVATAFCYSAWLYHKELGFIFALPSSCRQLLGCPSASPLPDSTSLHPLTYFPKMCAPCLRTPWQNIPEELQTSQVSTGFGSPRLW